MMGPSVVAASTTGTIVAAALTGLLAGGVPAFLVYVAARKRDAPTIEVAREQAEISGAQAASEAWADLAREFKDEVQHLEAKEASMAAVMESCKKELEQCQRELEQCQRWQRDHENGVTRLRESDGTPGYRKSPRRKPDPRD